MLSRARAAEAADPGQLASQLMIVFDGALVQSLLHRSAGPARDAREIAETLIDAATAKGDRTASAFRRQPCASHERAVRNPG
jgi:hypothetical protein